MSPEEMSIILEAILIYKDHLRTVAKENPLFEEQCQDRLLTLTSFTEKWEAFVEPINQGEELI